jgi:hypothetical protein
VTLDPDKTDDAVLALLQLGLHDQVRAWKTFDWDAMNRLHENGLISDPVGKAKAVVLTERGMAESKRLLEQFFEKKGEKRRKLPFIGHRTASLQCFLQLVSQ